MAVVRTRDQKPRLRPLGHPLCGGLNYVLWRCTGRGETAYAATPEMAYRMWHAKAFKAEAYFGRPEPPPGLGPWELKRWHRKVLGWLTAPTGSRGP